MTVSELKASNPWRIVADKYDSSNPNCLFLDDADTSYVHPDDLDRINQFNSHNSDKEYRIVTNTPPEPWRGNPLTARLIILSLNPGYSPEINMTLAKLLQSNPALRKDLMAFRQKTLNLEAKSLLPLPEDESGKGPITCKEAEDMLGAWYWTSKLKDLRNDFFDGKAPTTEEEDEFYKRIALIEFHGYSSIRAKDSFPLKGKNGGQFLKTQEFVAELIKHVARNKPNNEVCFLIMRSKSRWKDLLNGIWDEPFFKGKRIIREGSRNQAISKNNLGDDFMKISDVLKGQSKTPQC